MEKSQPDEVAHESQEDDETSLNSGKESVNGISIDLEKIKELLAFKPRG
jgi:hypothetical protein